MSSNLAVHASNLRKAYNLYPNSTARLKQIIAGEKRRYYREFVALEDVSFDLMKGEVLGVIGCNGAGKSTLLQLLCGTLAASSGTLKVHGRIAALLELGAGFNPDFSGRENIYLAAAVIGIKRAEIDLLMEGIIDFAGIRPFIDQPVKTYSSGMYVRLAFSVATSVDPDILIIDEALSVGDGDFARRSFDRIMAMRDAGKTILFCSHALYQVEVLCTRVIWLDAGKVVEVGAPDIVVPKYQTHLDQLSLGKAPATPADTDTDLSPSAATTIEKPMASRTRLLSTKVSADGVSGALLNVDSDRTTLRIEVDFCTQPFSEDIGIAVVVHTASDMLVSSCGSWNEGVFPKVDAQGYGSIALDFKALPLLKGRYTIGVLLFCEKGLFLHDEADPVCTIDVKQTGVARGLVNLPHQWQASSREILPADPVVTKAVKKPRWRAIDAQAIHEENLLALFNDSFGHRTSAAHWQWKYRFAASPGTLVLEGERAVAFNGGMPRNAYIQGALETVVQMGDVMVSPDQRGILTRRGPFYLSVMHFFKAQVGPGKNYSIAFGFPNARHARLGVKQGLYCQVDKIVQGRWPARAGRSLLLGSHPLDVTQLALIEPLWKQMQADAQTLAICARDAQWIEHRYFNKPNQSYIVLKVFHRLTRQIRGVIVLKPQGDDGVEILDIIAPQKNFPSLINIAQMATHRLGQKWLFGWFSPQAMRWSETTQPIIEETDVVIPGSAVNDETWSLRVKERWWLMGGDTDFK